jgi:hypothetical protein|tara:strand:+ start:964 stop:1092 length:129 start_codon:yes stop_codon:yes gene_type:complete
MASKLVKIHTLQKARKENIINEKEFVRLSKRVLKKKRKGRKK